MGLAGMGGAAGAGDALATLFDQRLRAAAEQRAQQHLEIQQQEFQQNQARLDALTRIAAQEKAESTARLLQKDHDEQTTRLNSQLSAIPQGTSISAGTQQSMVEGGVLPERFQPTPITPQGPPPSLAAVDQPPAEPMPGTVANSPAPAARTFQRIPTPAEQQTTSDESDQQRLIADPKTPAAMKQFLQLRAILPKGESVPAAAFTVPADPNAKFAEFKKEHDYRVAHPTASSGSAGTDPGAIADAIIAGDQPPTLQGLYRMGAPVRTALAQKGYNLTSATLDWEATKKHLSTLNGPQQTRMRQAVDNAYHSLDVIEDLAKQWDGGKFPTLNRASLALAKGGASGAKAQQIATNLEAQISDVTSELGNVYMGGNSPTDHALTLAQKNLSADWTKAQLVSAINLARRNLQIRQNSMNNVGPAGVSATNPYGSTAPATTAATGVPSTLPAAAKKYNPATGKVE